MNGLSAPPAKCSRYISIARSKTICSVSRFCSTCRGVAAETRCAMMLKTTLPVRCARPSANSVVLAVTMSRALAISTTPRIAAEARQRRRTNQVSRSTSSAGSGNCPAPSALGLGLSMRRTGTGRSSMRGQSAQCGPISQASCVFDRGESLSACRPTQSGNRAARIASCFCREVRVVGSCVIGWRPSRGVHAGLAYQNCVA